MGKVKGWNAQVLQIMQELDHQCSVNEDDSVVKLVEWFDDTKYVYIVLEACDSDLKIVFEDQSTELVTKLNMMEGAARAVAYIHSCGKMFRDVKDTNFLVKGNQVKIADFGLVEDIGTTVQAKDGTVGY